MESGHSSAPLHPRSAEIIASIQASGTGSLHPDFGCGPNDGIPYVVVPPSQARLPVSYDAYGGLPIFPGLVRFDEVAAGSIDHAIRVTFRHTRRGHVIPTIHFASSSPDPGLPPMGLHLWMQSDFDISGLTGQARVIAEAMTRHGLIVADNGSDGFFQGAPDPVWDDDDPVQLEAISGTAFEVVDTGPVRT